MDIENIKEAGQISRKLTIIGQAKQALIDFVDGDSPGNNCLHIKCVDSEMTIFLNEVISRDLFIDVIERELAVAEDALIKRVKEL